MDQNTYRVNIVYLITGLNTGGAEMMLYRLVKELNRSNQYQITVISILPPGKVAEKIKAEKIDVLSLNMRNKWDLGVIIKLVRILKKIKPHILHSYMFHANLLGRIAGRLANVPVNISGIRNSIFGGLVRERMMRYTDKFSDKTTIISYVAANRMIERKVVPEEKLQVIYNGLDSALFQPPESFDPALMREELGVAPGARVFLTVGRLQAQKGYPYLIEAAALLLEQGIAFQWLIAGEGEQGSRLEEMVREKNLTDHLTFLGLRDDIPQLLWCSDVFILSSLWEGLPGVLMEAMAAKVPVVATRVGGTSELVEDGKNGYLVSPKRPDELANAIKKLLELPVDKRLEMGQTGHEKVLKQFTVEQMVEQHEKLYNELMRLKGENRRL